jgi:hypothetical protein
MAKHGCCFVQTFNAGTRRWAMRFTPFGARARSRVRASRVRRETAVGASRP